MTQSALFQPLRLGSHDLAHRLVLPPLTRMRTPDPDNAPGAMNAEYYAQRASHGGLLIAEATWTHATGKPYAGVPGIVTDQQVRGWRTVTDAVHAKGGVIFLQLWHAGRIAHASTQPGGALPVAPSVVRPTGMIPDASGTFVPLETPRALLAAEIEELIKSFGVAARNAAEAGFDGVEIHGASGYLIEQFLHAHTNRRSDDYGGSLANRSRFLLDVTREACLAIGAHRVGVRLSPFGVAGDMAEGDPLPLFRYVIDALSDLRLAYLHVIEPRASGVGSAEVDRGEQPNAAALFRAGWPGVLISSGGYTPASAEQAVARGHADAIGFGRHFTSNPDLPERIRQGIAFTPYDRPTFYTPGPKGYVDFARAT